MHSTYGPHKKYCDTPNRYIKGRRDKQRSLVYVILACHWLEIEHE